MSNRSAEKSDCIHLGEQTGYRDCPTCSRTVRLKVYECQHPNHEEITVQECRKCTDYQGPEEVGFINRWCVGVTTAPRAQPTLERTLESLANAGWAAPHLFAEPDTVIPDCARDLTISHRPTTMGAFPNWYLSLTEMVLKDPTADAYFLCQDDIVLSAGLREYLDAHLWPAPAVGVVSVYCAKNYDREGYVGFHQINDGGNTCGALAYIFSNPSARALLTDELFMDHRHHGPRAGLKNIDSVVGLWCRERNQPYFVHSPSLAQHIGDTSTLWTSGVIGRRRARTFAEDSQLLNVTNALSD